ncbi:MAG: HAD family hydrolase [Myxococcota bacterium]|jgi:putative hydrolase of the HAD superfamily
MTKRKIQAVTFDLWDTVFIDDSDEPKRKAKGLQPKAAARRAAVHRFLERHAPISAERVALAYDTTDAAFRLAWHDQHVTWTVRQRLGIVLSGLGRELPDDELDELVRIHETMELGTKPDLVPGIGKALAELAGRYALGVISDAIFTPGWALREILDGYGLLGCFSGFVFSDEVAASKPAPKTFHEAARVLGVAVDGIVHVGDREHNDVAGPHAVGARAVLITAAIDRGSANTKADAICRDCADLPAIIGGLE